MPNSETLSSVNEVNAVRQPLDKITTKIQGCLCSGSPMPFCMTSYLLNAVYESLLPLQLCKYTRFPLINLQSTALAESPDLVIGAESSQGYACRI